MLQPNQTQVSCWPPFHGAGTFLRPLPAVLKDIGKALPLQQRLPTLERQVAMVRNTTKAFQNRRIGLPGAPEPDPHAAHSFSPLQNHHCSSSSQQAMVWKGLAMDSR